MLRRLLEAIEQQDTKGGFTVSATVVDNDAQESARATVEEFARGSRLKTVYRVEPRMNIALARNRSLADADGQFVAFIDDDEFPVPEWLQCMLAACESLGCAGVLGPVRPHFEEPPPAWIIKGGFCDRPEHPTGRVMHWEECRTGNVLVRRDIIGPADSAFDPFFGNGGEDKDFFMRMAHKGHVFRWCNEGVAYETVPPERWTRQFMVRRALLRGKNILKHPEGRGRLIAQSVVAVPLYGLVLPFTAVAGQHVFMKYCIKFCDHAGRLLALVGLNKVAAR